MVILLKCFCPWQFVGFSSTHLIHTWKILPAMPTAPPSVYHPEALIRLQGNCLKDQRAIHTFTVWPCLLTGGMLLSNLWHLSACRVVLRILCCVVQAVPFPFLLELLVFLPKVHIRIPEKHRRTLWSLGNNASYFTWSFSQRSLDREVHESKVPILVVSHNYQP